MKLLHSADWHLDAPLSGYSDAQSRFLRQALLSIPEKITALARQERCDLILLSGDLFDGPYTKTSLDTLRTALGAAGIPVFIAPGNHDFCSAASPWLAECWPENVHIFTSDTITSVALPHLDCRVYGAAFQSMDCPSLLADFHSQCSEKYALGVFHGDPMQLHSPYNPVTAHQVQESGLDYLALGHIHKSGSFRAGAALCGWPGSPMGRGFDETGTKGAFLVTLDDKCAARFVSLHLPEFHDLRVDAQCDPVAALHRLLPPAGSSDFYRITFTGESGGINTAALCAAFSRFPHLQLRDQTQPPVDLWKDAGKDTLEGIYFSMLKQMSQSGDTQASALLAARISRLILDGQEVELP